MSSDLSNVPHFPELKGKKVLLVSHTLTVTGAPLLLAETGVQMIRSGAAVGLTNLAERDAVFPFSESDGFVELAIDESFDFARSADLIIANTAVAKTWVDELLVREPQAGSRTVWWIHEVDMAEYGGGMENFANVATAIFDSEYCRELWQQTGLMPPIAITIPPGVAESLYQDARRLTGRTWSHTLRRLWPGHRTSQRDEVRTSLGITADDFFLVCIAQYCTLKGQDLLVRAVGHALEESPELPLKLVLVGFHDDVEKESFVSRLTPSQQQAIGPNRVFNRVGDCRPYYLAGDAFVLNTQPPGETFGMVTIEAMSFGLPVLVTSTGGIPEVVIDGVTGLHHPPGEEGEAKLIANIHELMKDRQLAKRLGKAGLERVKKHYRAEKFYREFAKTISQVLSRAG